MAWLVACFRRPLIAAEELNDRGVPAFAPFELSWTKPARKHQPVKMMKPIFFDMLFVLDQAMLQQKLEKLKGFKYIVTSNDVRLELDDSIIDELRQRQELGEWDFTVEHKETLHLFAVGDRVKVTFATGVVLHGDIDAVISGSEYWVNLPGWWGRSRVRGCLLEPVDVISPAVG